MPVFHRARLGFAALPLKALGATTVALLQRFAGKWLVFLLFPVGVVAQSQLDGVEAKFVAELVHRRLEGEGSAGLAGSASEGRRRYVEAYEAVRRLHVGARVEHP